MRADIERIKLNTRGQHKFLVSKRDEVEAEKLQYRKDLCREQRTNSKLRGSSLNDSRYESQLAAKNQKIEILKDQNSYLDSEVKSQKKEITKLRKGSASKGSRDNITQGTESILGSYIQYERPSSAFKPKKLNSCTHAQSMIMSPTMLPKSSISPVRKQQFKSGEGKGYSSALQISEQQSGQKEEARLTAKHDRMNSTQKYAIESDEDNLHAVNSFVHQSFFAKESPGLRFMGGGFTPSSVAKKTRSQAGVKPSVTTTRTSSATKKGSATKAPVEADLHLRNQSKGQQTK